MHISDQKHLQSHMNKIKSCQEQKIWLSVILPTKLFDEEQWHLLSQTTQSTYSYMFFYISNIYYNDIPIDN